MSPPNSITDRKAAACLHSAHSSYADFDAVSAVTDLKRFVISGTAFCSFHDELVKELPLISEHVTAHTTVLDYKTACLILSSPSQCLPKQSEFLIIGLTGVLQDDIQTIINRITSGKEKTTVHLMLNCALISPSTAADLVRSIQYSMPRLDTHILSFSLICNDAEIPEYADMLTNFFRATQPGYNRKQLKMLYRHVLHQAWYIRYFAWNPVLRFVAKMYQKMRSLLKR